MTQKNTIIQQDDARIDLYVELHKGLKAIEEGRTKTSEEVRKHMEALRKKYISS